MRAALHSPPKALTASPPRSAQTLLLLALHALHAATLTLDPHLRSLKIQVLLVALLQLPVLLALIVLGLVPIITQCVSLTPSPVSNMSYG